LPRRDSVPTAVTIIAAAVWSAVVFFHAFPDPQGTDFYPLWLGTQVLMAGDNPYSPATAELLRSTWLVKRTVQVADVIGYPLPVLMLLTPLTVLTLDQAILVWFALLLISIGLFAAAFDKKVSVFLIPLLFLPTFHALLIKTSTILWMGLIGLLMVAIKNKMSSTIGLCIALLPGKPQVGLIFAMAAVIWSIKENNRTVLVSALFWTLALWGGSLLVQPAWPLEWWRALGAYREQVMLIWLLPQGIVLPLFSRSLSWFAVAAAIQVVAFPHNDIYSSLPLLVGWMEIGGWLAWLGVICSWLATLLYQNPNNPLALWMTVLLPYCTAALIHTFVKLRNEKENHNRGNT